MFSNVLVLHVVRFKGCMWCLDQRSPRMYVYITLYVYTCTLYMYTVHVKKLFMNGQFNQPLQLRITLNVNLPFENGNRNSMQSKKTGNEIDMCSCSHHVHTLFKPRTCPVQTNRPIIQWPMKRTEVLNPRRSECARLATYRRTRIIILY